MDNIMFGRIEFTIAYNNIIKILNSILTTEELEEFETSCNLIYDSLQYGISNEEDEIIPIQVFSDDNLYSIFRQEINKVFDNILLKFGIKSNIISITEYLTIFTLLQNLKCNLLERESYSQIYYGDYGVEDKLYMLLEDLINSPIEILKNFDVGDLFWLKVEEYVNTIPIDINLEMITRAMNISNKDNRFTSTILFKDITENRETIMLDLITGLDAVESIIRNNISNYEKHTNITNSLLEICFTYLYYNTGNNFRLTKYVNTDYLNIKFKLNYSHVEITNILSTIDVEKLR